MNPTNAEQHLLDLESALLAWNVGQVASCLKQLVGDLVAFVLHANLDTQRAMKAASPEVFNRVAATVERMKGEVQQARETASAGGGVGEGWDGHRLAALLALAEKLLPLLLPLFV